MKNVLFNGLILIAICLVYASCKKEFLDVKPDKALMVPETLEDFQALLNNTEIMNKSHVYDFVSTDEFVATSSSLQNLDKILRNSYLWNDDLYEGSIYVYDWDYPYQQIFYCNIILEGLQKIKDQSVNYASIKGTALFIRAWAYYCLMQQFAKPYDKNTANSDDGVPIRLSSNVNDRPDRGTVQKNYEQIITDLNTAIPLLPENVAFKTRPVAVAGIALLARVYFTMEDYYMAEKYADLSLSKYNGLIDFNTLTANATSPVNPFPLTTPYGNNEVLFYAFATTYSFLTSATTTTVDTDMLTEYGANDLRKSLFFVEKPNSVVNFKGKYSGSTAMFNGIANSEVYLISAESKVRNGNVNGALSVLNKLLSNRIKKDTYQPIAIRDQEELLNYVIQERRRELFGKGLRWTDLRRLNKDPRFSKTLKRELNGIVYSLPPNDKRYVFSLPIDEITEQIIQNER